MIAPVSQAGVEPAVTDAPRLARLVQEQFGFVWRLLRRTGISRAAVGGAAHHVFAAAARRIGDIRAGSERAFLFSAALHVGAPARRERLAYSAELTSHAEPDTAMLDALLAEMPLELRVVLVLYELEQLHCTEISEIVGVPIATVASRLRSAREDFSARTARLEGAAGVHSMSVLDEPPRLAEEGGELTRALLEAARKEGPDPSALEQELAAIGESLVVLESAPQTPPAELTTKVAHVEVPGVESNVPERSSAGAVIVKWLLLGAAIGIALSTVIYALNGAFAEPASGTETPRR